METIPNAACPLCKHFFFLIERQDKKVVNLKEVKEGQAGRRNNADNSLQKSSCESPIKKNGGDADECICFFSGVCIVGRPRDFVNQTLGFLSPACA